MGTSALLPGCSIEWQKESAKQTRLLDWLESHPEQRSCLFLEKNAPAGLSRTKCAAQAAQYVFQNDENPKNRAGVIEKPTPFAYAVVKLIWRGPSSWKTKYERVNKALGPQASKLPYSEFQAGSHLRKKAVSEIKKFPQWERLHHYWRTSPHFNPYVKKTQQPSSEPTVKASKKRKIAEEEYNGGAMTDFDPESEEDDDEESEPVIATPVVEKPPPAMKPRSKAGPSIPVKKRARRVSNGSSVGKTVTFSTEQSSNDITEATRDGSFHAQLTAEQLFQLQMAEIQYRTKREENIARQQEQRQQVLVALLEAVKPS